MTGVEGWPAVAVASAGLIAGAVVLLLGSAAWTLRQAREPSPRIQPRAAEAAQNDVVSLAVRAAASGRYSALVAAARRALVVEVLRRIGRGLDELPGWWAVLRGRAKPEVIELRRLRHRVGSIAAQSRRIESRWLPRPDFWRTAEESTYRLRQRLRGFVTELERPSAPLAERPAP